MVKSSSLSSSYLLILFVLLALASSLHQTAEAADSIYNPLRVSPSELGTRFDIQQERENRIRIAEVRCEAWARTGWFWWTQKIDREKADACIKEATKSIDWDTGYNKSLRQKLDDECNWKFPNRSEGWDDCMYKVPGKSGVGPGGLQDEKVASGEEKSQDTIISASESRGEITEGGGDGGSILVVDNTGIGDNLDPNASWGVNPRKDKEPEVEVVPIAGTAPADESFMCWWFKRCEPTQPNEPGVADRAIYPNDPVRQMQAQEFGRGVLVMPVPYAEDTLIKIGDLESRDRAYNDSSTDNINGGKTPGQLCAEGNDAFCDGIQGQEVGVGDGGFIPVRDNETEGNYLQDQIGILGNEVPATEVGTFDGGGGGVWETITNWWEEASIKSARQFSNAVLSSDGLANQNLVASAFGALFGFKK